MEIEVTQADREAAASVAVLAEMRELILSGRADHHAEPWTRHRLAAIKERDAQIVAWLREKQQQAMEWANYDNSGDAYTIACELRQIADAIERGEV